MGVHDRVISRAVHRLRTGLGLSQQELADAMRERGWKWNQTTVWSVEGDRRPLRLSESVDLAELLAVPLDGLLRDPLSSLLDERTAEYDQAIRRRDSAAAAAGSLEGTVTALRAFVDAHSGAEAHLPIVGIAAALDAFGNAPWSRTSAILVHLGVPADDVERIGAMHQAWAQKPLDLSDPMEGPPKPVDSPDFAVWDELWKAISRALPSLDAPEPSWVDEA